MRHWSAVAAVLIGTTASPAAALQLRPLEPLEWRAMEAGDGVRLSFALGAFVDQRVALAGVRGDLFELGDARAAFRSARFMIEVAGTPQRFLRGEQFVEAPTGGARPMDEHRRRHDAGDYRIATVVALSDAADGSFETLRFGTRLPTTDNKVGLDRDQTDFFALLGAQRRWSGLRGSVEAGVGINGTRRPEYEQSDALTYALALSYTKGIVQPSLIVVGQNDLRSERTRGNEDLSELRAVLRAGQRRWLQAAVVVGLAEFSPRVGFTLGAGVHLDDLF